MSEAKTLYIIRHCKACGQQSCAQLTAEGYLQAHALAVRLANVALERIVCRPVTWA